jgi:UDP-GlcNAc:undecaprenyl-phosphate/decaprenyl-phosphate GlcNAc-1-phosphate transferase
LPLAVPLAEIAFAVVRRRRAGLSVLEGDRGHPYDRLVRRGWSPRSAALTYVGAEAVVAAAALLAARARSVSVPVVAAGAVAAAIFGIGAATGMLNPEPGAPR